MSLFEKFLDKITDNSIVSNVAETLCTLDPKQVKAGANFLGHALPWFVGIGFTMCGVYGVETYLAVDFAKGVRENLKKAKMLGDSQKDFYTLIGDKIIEEDEYNKIKNKQLGLISDENSAYAIWKSVYDK